MGMRGGVMGAKYFVTTWDTDQQDFTPQEGVPAGPWTLWGLRIALRALRELGYIASRFPRPDGGDPSVLVERRYG